MGGGGPAGGSPSAGGPSGGGPSGRPASGWTGTPGRPAPNTPSAGSPPHSPGRPGAGQSVPSQRTPGQPGGPGTPHGPTQAGPHVPNQAGPHSPGQPTPGHPGPNQHAPNQAGPNHHAPGQATPHSPNSAAPHSPAQPGPHNPNQAAPHSPNQAGPDSSHQPGSHNPNQGGPHSPAQAGPHNPNQAGPHNPSQAGPHSPHAGPSQHAPGQTGSHGPGGHGPNQHSPNHPGPAPHHPAGNPHATSPHSPNQHSPGQHSPNQHAPNHAGPHSASPQGPGQPGPHAYTPQGPGATPRQPVPRGFDPGTGPSGRPGPQHAGPHGPAGDRPGGGRPHDPNRPADPTRPGDPNRPGNANHPHDPNRPTDPNGPADPNRPGDANSPADPNRPRDPNHTDPSNTDPNRPDPNRADPSHRPDADQPHNRDTKPQDHDPNDPKDPTDPNHPHDRDPDGGPHDKDPDQPDPGPDRDPLPPDQVNLGHHDQTPAGSSYHRGDPEMGDLPQRVRPDPDGRYTVDVHVTPEGNARIGGRDYTPEEFADILRRNGDYDGRPVRLIGCDAGSNDFANRLSRELDTPVLAPDRPAWTDSNGNVFSSDYEIGPDGRVQPRIPPNGEWSVHNPDGTTHHAGDTNADPHDIDAGDAQARGAGDNINPHHQLDERWQEPDGYTHADDPIRLDNHTSLFDDPGRRLEPNTRYEVEGPDGNTRSVVYTDAHGNVSHVDAVAPNRNYSLDNPGSASGRPDYNPEIARPAPNADYRVRTGDRADVYPTGPDGSTRLVTDGGATRVGHVETPPATRPDGSPVPRQPVANQDPDLPFGQHRDPATGNPVPTQLQPNTRYDVTDAAGHDRGTFQTDDNGHVRWVDTPDHADGWRNPDLEHPHPDANYRVERGPDYQEYHVGPDGRPEPGAPWRDPQPTGTPETHTINQRDSFYHRGDQPGGLAPDTEHRTVDSRGHEHGRYYTNEHGQVDQADLQTGQRGRTNPEVTSAPPDAHVTQDGYYGTDMESPVQDSWPTPEHEYRYSNEQRGGFDGGERPDGVSARHEKALSKPLDDEHPVVDRRLPPNSRINILDADGNPHVTIQTGPDGRPTHVHSANDAELDAAERRGVDVTRDDNYGTDGAASPESDWPDPDREFDYSHERGPRGFDGGEPDGLDPAHRDAITRDTSEQRLTARTDLPPDSRVTLSDRHGPIATVQTDATGAVTHVHTYRPFHPALNDPIPNATVRVDAGMEVRNPHAGPGEPPTRVTEGTVHRNDERGNTVATTSRPEYDGATDRRRDEKAQQDVGGQGGKHEGPKGRSIDDGGHHQGTHEGGGGEKQNQSIQGRTDNQGVTVDQGKKIAEPDYDRSQTWKAMEETRDRERRVELEDTMPAREPGVDDPHTRHYRGHATDDQGRPHVIVRSFPVDHNTPLWPADFRQ
jgi:hypothetical protein